MASLICRRCKKQVQDEYEHHSGEDYDGTWICSIVEEPRVDERTAFMRRILAVPEDDNVRLVFADWLEEHDEADRAEFIRLQIADSHPQRQAILRCRNPQWMREPCLECIIAARKENEQCTICGFARDLLKQREPNIFQVCLLRKIVWERGFICSIGAMWAELQYYELMHTDAGGVLSKSEGQLHPWVKAILLRHPITSFIDRERTVSAMEYRACIPSLCTWAETSSS
jgi:uncharacterized protein (TIGR02996 family)